MNILPLVMGYFGPVIMNKIAGSLGINSTLAQRAIAAAAPAILAGIIGKTMQPGGAKVLSDLIAKQDPTLLSKLSEMIGTGRQAAVVEQGSSALSGLLGTSTSTAVSGALSKYVGLGAGASNTLMGLMAPAVLGTLGREQKASGLDAAGLANTLQAQKQQIVDALPPEFAKLLASTGLLETVRGKPTDEAPVRPATQPVSTASPRPTTAATPSVSTSKPATPTTTSGKPTMPAAHAHHHFSWGPWLVAIAAACALWWAVFGNKAMQTQTTQAIPEDVPASTTHATAVLPDAVARTDAGKSVVTLLDDTRSAMTSVRDVASAQAAAPRLQDLSARLDKVMALFAQLSPDQRHALTGYITSQMTSIRSLAATVLALPGIGPILKPVVDQVMGRLETLSKA